MTHDPLVCGIDFHDSCQQCQIGWLHSTRRGQISVEAMIGWLLSRCLTAEEVGMTTTELLKIVAARGLKVVLKDGRPVLEGAANNPAVTPKLLAVLKRHRDRIIEMITPKPTQQQLFRKEHDAYQ